MKVLVLSLLRMGDFLQQVPLLETLLQEGHDVHVLANESLRDMSTLFEDLEFHFLPREILQRLLTTPECNVLSAFQLVEETIHTLNAEKFEAIENWTHNFLSARLMDLLEAPIKKGAHFREGRLASSTKSMAYLNETWGPTTAASFHWVDALARAMGHSSPVLEIADRGRQGPIYLQVLTSDEKKNWDLNKWKELASLLIAKGEDVRVLCAPFEADRLREKGFGGKYPLAILDLKDLVDALGLAKLVVTGDTSIAHWAALLGTPILGLYLGPADPRKTAPRLLGARLLWADVDCSPCRHRSPCSRATHLCETQLTTSTVYKEVIQMTDHEPRSFDLSSVQRLDVIQGASGASVLQSEGRRSINLWAQVVWDFYLNRDHDTPVAPYGSAARLVLQTWGYQRATQDWIQTMKSRLDLSFDMIGVVSESLWLQMKSFNEHSAIPNDLEQKMIEATLQLSTLWCETDFITRLFEAQKTTEANPFVRIRQKKEALQEVFELFSVQKNLVKVMEQEFKERGERGARA